MMATVIETFIICDDCGETFGVDNRNYTAKQHRENAAKDGWKTISENQIENLGFSLDVGGKIKDLCPNCARFFSVKTNP